MFGSALLRREGVRGFGFGIGCSGVIQMTRDGCRQVGTGRIGVGSVTVVTEDHYDTIAMNEYRTIRAHSAHLDLPKPKKSRANAKNEHGNS